MGLTDWANAIRVHFNTEWTTLGTPAPVAWENVEYEPTTGTSYVQFVIRQVEADWGSPGWADNLGAVIIAVYVPINQGPEVGETLAEQVASCFRNKTFDSDSGWFDLPSAEPIGVYDGFYQINVRIPWYHQETVS